MEYEIDARNLFCPMPVIRLQQQAEAARPGDIIRIRFTDPGGEHDIPAWCRVHGHRVLSVEHNDLVHCITVEVQAPE